MSYTSHQSRLNVQLPASVSVSVPAGHVVVVQPVDDQGRPLPATPAQVYITPGAGEFEFLLDPPSPHRADVHVVEARVQPPGSASRNDDLPLMPN